MANIPLLDRKKFRRILQKIAWIPTPKMYFEQYQLPPETVTDLMFLAGQVYDDIKDKIVFDLGCGTGILAIASVLTGAKFAVGIDIDLSLIKQAKLNARLLKIGSKLAWIQADVRKLNAKCDTVIQNPPFGVKRKGADRPFLKTALKIADVVYSIHKSGKENRLFLKRFIEKNGGKITDLILLKFPLPPTFPTHKKRKLWIEVDLYRIERR